MFAQPSVSAKVVAAVAAVGLVPFGLVAVGQFPDSQEPSSVLAAPAAAFPSSDSWLAIQTGSTSRVTLNDASGVLDTQALGSAANCGITQGVAADRLVTFSGFTGRGSASDSLASYANGSIGVKEKKSGTSCAQVNAPLEILTLSLGQGLDSSALATSAYLDVELKQNARILATASRDGAADVLFELQSGSSVGSTPLTGVAAGRVATCTNGSDSGPDSGVGDNCRWALSVPSWLGADDGVSFSTLTLTAVTGSFSLEGGADGAVLPPAGVAPANASVLELEGEVLDCNESTTTLAADGGAPEVTITRLGNADGSEVCETVPYSLTHGPGFVQFLKPLDDQLSAQFIWDVTWSLPATAPATLPVLTIDYEVPTSALLPLGWCPDATYDAQTGAFLGYSGGLPAGTVDQDTDIVGVQFACVISRSAASVSPSGVTLHDLVYVHGDARLRV